MYQDVFEFKGRNEAIGKRVGQLALNAALLAMLAACGGGGDVSGGESSAPAGQASVAAVSQDTGGDKVANASSMSPVAGQMVGRISYDNVPVSAHAGLDYAATRQMPARGVMVEAVSASNVVIATTSTDEQGHYTLAVPEGTEFKVRVQARLLPSDKRWDVAVRDNRSAGYPQAAAAYAMSSSLQTISAAGGVLDLNAKSGWTGSAYGETRASAPFAILDQAYASMQYVRSFAPGTQFPALTIYWSKDNRSAVGSYADGDITSSNWSPASTGQAEGIYVLGKENLDSDEFDASVLRHEWMHYFESKLSRSDSLGGAHAFGDKLDMRVAWSEGMASAMGAAIGGTSVFQDTKGLGQGQTSAFHVDVQPGANDRGFYSESSVQYLVYQMAQMQGGAEAVISTLLNEQKNTPSLTSLMSFAAGLSTRMGSSAVDAVMAKVGLPVMQSINEWGAVVNYRAMVDGEKPAFRSLATGAAASRVCVSNEFVGYNKLDRHRPVRVDVTVAGNYSFKAPYLSGPTTSVARVELYRVGQWQPPKSALASEKTYYLQPGTYVAMLTDASMDQGTAAPNTHACFNASWEQVP
ncbi:hypothetical protein KUF54_02190 [Comamonas sp. Y33R10-2]|uniref:hypothetical protein n=1 Tax=Comamonas sp. Y33R10-2 TaxID=2853257 RepID=UPI001C5CB5FF|nr:hypothetical protein [Comamonas sp. Y33R10-2]QXZ10097.1 hypothetical protein KUF54_02190 [Comamonas sp. Y33R10-2]